MAKNPPKILSNGLVLHIPGIYSGNTYYDISGNGNNGTGSNVTNTRTLQHNVMGFNGGSSTITFPNINGILGISFWFYPTANNKNIILISSGNSVNISSSNTIIVSGLTNSTIYVNGRKDIKITQSQWNHVFVSFDSINSSSGSIGNSQFTGGITNVRFYNRQPTQTEINLIRNSEYIK